MRRSSATAPSASVCYEHDVGKGAPTPRMEASALPTQLHPISPKRLCIMRKSFPVMSNVMTPSHQETHQSMVLFERGYSVRLVAPIRALLTFSVLA
jgi:hypothetical protein